MMKFFSRTRRAWFITLNLALVLAFVVAALPQPAMAATTADTSCNVKHTVQSGETLTSIADKYTVNWRDVATANSLLEPYTIYVSQVLCIPGQAASSTSGSTTTSKTPDVKVTKWTKTQLTVAITGFTPKLSYIFRSSANIWGDRTYYRLGRIRTDKNGAATVTLLLPKELRNQSELIVCAKNAINDVAVCKKFRPTE